MTNEASSNAIIGNTLRIIASGEYHPGAELTQKMASYIIELEQKLTDMSVHLANDKSKCRELAAIVAENAALKTAAKETVAHWAAAEAGEMELMMDKCMPALRDAYCETPATDTFLAEVRAQGVEAFVMDFTEPAVMNNGTFYNEDLVEASNEFAAQLRKGSAL